MAWSDASETGGGTAPDAAPYQLLDDGFAPEPCELLVIGCGNILRGDDAVGPVLVRHLYERGVPDGVRVVDGGTSGMDVAFGMRGAGRVVIVDAASTGAEPGTVYRVPAEELAELPPIDGLHTHNFRWDHALSFSAWLLGPERPTDVTVYLVEAGSLEPGAPLTPAVEAGMWRVVELVERDHFPGAEGRRLAHNDMESVEKDVVVGQTSPPEAAIELTPDGYLHVPADLAAKHFPGDAVVARLVDDDGAGRTLELVPLASVGHGGLLLKRRNAAGDRSALIHQELDFHPVAGRFDVEWDDDRGALLVPLDPAPDGSRRGDRGAHRGGGRARPMDGLPGGDHAGRGGATAAGDPSHGGAGEAGGRRRTPDGGAAPPPAGGTR